MTPRGDGQTPIMSQESCIEYFSQGDIHGIVGTEIVPQRPDTGQQETVRVPPDGKADEIVEGCLGPLRFDLSRHRESANDLGDFDIEQVRRMESLGPIKQPAFDSFTQWRPQQNLQQSRGVNDDHRLSRSWRTASAVSTERVTVDRRANRARISSIVGRSATSRICCSR